MRHEERARANIVEVGQRLHARACVASNDGNINVLAHAAFADLGGDGMRAEGGAPLEGHGLCAALSGAL